jgi:transcriptional antiterminator RfaH
MKYWYAVRTKSRCEAFAEANLQRLGVEVFLPMLKAYKKTPMAHCKSVTPLFPGYLFVRCAMPAQYRAVSYATIVDDSIIDSIKRQVVSGVIQIADDRLVPGKAVRIHEGSLCGLDAVFEKKLSGSNRVVLLLKAISYQARLILEPWRVSNM